MLGDFFCHVLRLFCQIDYFQSLFTSILIRLCHSSPRMCNIANRVSGILNKILIAFGYRRLEVIFFKTLGINNGIKNRFIKDIKRKIRNHQMVLFEWRNLSVTVVLFLRHGGAKTPCKWCCVSVICNPR